MNDWKNAVATKTAELVAKGLTAERATKRALKACKPLHPAHRAAMIRRASMADDASKATGTFHAM